MIQDRLSSIKEIFKKEILEIIREWKIIIFAVILPVIIYPFIFFGIDKLYSLQEEKLKKTGVNIGIINATGSDNLNQLFAHAEVDINLIPLQEISNKIKDKTIDIILDVSHIPENSGKQFWLLYEGSIDRSIVAYRNVANFLDQQHISYIVNGINLEDPEKKLINPLSYEQKDITSIKAKSGHLIGKILPFILILMLISGCSYTAIDTIAGEKERGNLETILVSGLNRQDIILAKFLVVLTSGLVSVVLNIAGMLLTLRLGLFKNSKSIDFSFQIDFGTIVAVMGCVLPIGILLSAVLLLFSAKAKSYQEGQVYLLPITLFSILPVLAAVLPGMKAQSFLMFLPIANISIAIKEYLEGVSNIPLLIAVNLINLTYAAGILYWCVRYLEKEGTLVSAPSLSFNSGKKQRLDLASTVFVVFIAVWLLLFFVFSQLQAKSIVFGLLATLYGLILGTALLFSYVFKLSFRSVFSIRSVSLKTFLLGIPISLSLVSLMQWLMIYQMKYLPTPKIFMDSMHDTFQSQDLSITMSIFLFGISPGICEEMLFRGVIFKSFLQRFKPWQAILFSSMMFGFLHFSIYRFIPTTLIGIILSCVVYITGSIFPAMWIHALVNVTSLHLWEEYFTGDFNNLWYLLGIPVLGISILLLINENRNRFNYNKENDDEFFRTNI